MTQLTKRVSKCNPKWPHIMEERALKIVTNCLNTNIYSYLETPGSKICNLYLNVVHFFNTSVN
jgi:hypothetical protein